MGDENLLSWYNTQQEVLAWIVEATKVQAAQLLSNIDIYSVVALETPKPDLTPPVITPTLPARVAHQFSPDGSELPIEDYIVFARGKNRLGDTKIEGFLGRIVGSGNIRRCLRSNDEIFFWRATSESTLGCSSHEYLYL